MIPELSSQRSQDSLNSVELQQTNNQRTNNKTKIKEVTAIPRWIRDASSEAGTWLNDLGATSRQRQSLRLGQDPGQMSPIRVSTWLSVPFYTYPYSHVTAVILSYLTSVPARVIPSANRSQASELVTRRERSNAIQNLYEKFKELRTATLSLYCCLVLIRSRQVRRDGYPSGF